MRRRTKWLAGLVGVVGIVALLVAVFQADLGRVLYGRIAEQRVGRDITAALPDGLHIAICGSGSPMPDPSRAGPCTVVIAGKRIFVVDAGEGGARNIALMGLPPGRIERVFLTHFHSDHIDGLGPMMLFRWTGSAATAPLPVHGPPGVDAVITGFNAAYATDNGYRTAHHGARIVPPSGAGAKPMPFDLPLSGSLVLVDESGLKVTAFRVDHGPVKPAVGYRFDYKGRSVVISGDTVPVAALAAAAKGADILVAEALQPALLKQLSDVLDRRGQKNTAQITRDILNYHMKPEQAADIARAAGVKQLLLTHIVPPMPLRFAYPAFLGDAPDRFDGPIVVGEDGMMFSLPAQTTKIERKSLL
jgi:ribonuclease Z